MFDMKEIGCKIAKLRKEKNMTQMELADALGISFQAISNWERGESMPDIAKLVSLSQIFDVSIDEILGNDRIAKTVSELASGTEKEPLDTEVIKEIAPIVKPDQLSKLVNDSMKLMMENVSHMDFKPGTSQTITEITPNGSVLKVHAFPSEDATVQPQTEKQTISMEYTGSPSFAACDSASYDNTSSIPQESEASYENKEKAPSLKNLLELAPFMAEEDLGELVFNYADQVDNFNDIISLAPFLDEEVIDYLVHHYSNSDLDFHKILALAPFCSEDVLGSLALQYIKQIDNFDKVVSLAPFLDEDILSELVETNLDLTLNMEQFKQLLPFLNEDTVGKIARKLLLK